MQKKRDRREYNRAWYLAHRESEIQKNRKYYAENKEFCKSLVKDWRQRHPEKIKEFNHTRTVKHLDRELEKIRKWKAENPDRVTDAEKRYSFKQYHRDPQRWIKLRRDATRALKIETINTYGGKCSCCGENTIEFLTIDHVQGGGTQHLKGLRKRGTLFYVWLKQQGFPKGEYQCLCWNCNCAKGMFGVCPHQRR